MTEAERALQYRRDQQAIEDARFAREKALRGDKPARKALEVAWSPFLPWDGWDPAIKVDEEAADFKRDHLGRLGAL